MTTSHSPYHQLKAQADRIAKYMKQAERGDISDHKVRAARLKPTFKTGVVMDDKTFTLEMPWEKIRETDEATLSAFVIKHMRGEIDN